MRTFFFLLAILTLVSLGASLTHAGPRFLSRKDAHFWASGLGADLPFRSG
jgi:hypothetical protein